MGSPSARRTRMLALVRRAQRRPRLAGEPRDVPPPPRLRPGCRPPAGEDDLVRIAHRDRHRLRARERRASRSTSAWPISTSTHARRHAGLAGAGRLDPAVAAGPASVSVTVVDAARVPPAVLRDPGARRSARRCRTSPAPSRRRSAPAFASPGSKVNTPSAPTAQVPVAQFDGARRQGKGSPPAADRAARSRFPGRGAWRISPGAGV